MRIFTLLLNTKVDSVNEIKRILKIAINTTLRLWSGKNDGQTLAKDKSCPALANEQTSTKKSQEIF